MMNDVVVKEIKQQKNPGLFSIITEDGFEFSLTVKGIYENSVRVGSTFTQSQFNKIKDYASQESSYRYAVYLLGRRDWSSGEMIKKLTEKGKHAEQTVEKLINQGYINDKEYSKKIIDKYIKKYGKKRIEEELYKRYLPKELWRDELDTRCCDMTEQILKHLAKKMKNNPFTDRKERDKIYAYFVRQGYSYENITKAFNEYNNGDFDD